MKKFFKSLNALDGWVVLFDNLRELVIGLFILDLLENKQYVGFALVVIIFSFRPVAMFIRSRSNRDNR